MKERLKWVEALERGEETVSEICARAGVSRKTGYKWWGRYREEGLEGLKERSRAPLHHPNAVSSAVVRLLLKAKQRYPNWGPEKLLVVLAQAHPDQRFPSVSTAAEILRRHNLVRVCRPRRRSPPYSAPFQAIDGPNAVWSADFKGQFRTADARLCYPLTVSDSFSRYLLCCQAMYHPTERAVRRAMERVFREYGLPRAIRTDNGAPFASTALGGLSRLSAWWIRLGIRPERIAPGHPEQNGRHERLHWTLKQDTAMPPRANLAGQQRAFERFRTQYNEQRPHAALAQRAPAQYYQGSLRAYPARLPELEYPEDFVLRRVRHNGEIKWRSRRLYLTQVLAGQAVGLRQIDELCWQIHFGPLAIGVLDERDGRVWPLPSKPVHTGP